MAFFFLWVWGFDLPIGPAAPLYYPAEAQP
jgi:hypothetical protein